MKLTFSAPVLALALSLWVPAVWAQDAPVAVETTLSPAEQSALDEARRVSRVEELWRTSLVWQETGASLEKVVDDVRAQLGPDAPTIEVRVPKSNATRSTFTLKTAPLGETLCAVAELANCQVWAFADGLVIGPQGALSPDELSAISRKVGGRWDESGAATSLGWSGRSAVERLSLGFIGADIKAKLAAKGQVGPMVPPPVAPKPATPATGAPATIAKPDAEPTAPYELPFGELSSASKALLQDLIAAQTARYGRPTKTEAAPTPIAPEAVIGFDDKYSLQLFVRGTTLPSWQTHWYAR